MKGHPLASKGAKQKNEITRPDSGSNAKKAGQIMNDLFNFKENLFTTVFRVADNKNGVKLFLK